MLNISTGERYVKGLYDVILENSILDSVEYVKPFLNDVLIAEKDDEVWTIALNKVTVDGLHAEFGVYQGKSINWLSNRKDVQWYGFDSFLGLDEDWKGSFYPKGHFSLKGNPPKVNSNVELVIGTFEQTFANFVATHPQPFAFMNIDCDTYKATKHILDTAKNQIVSGSIIIFDEYLAHPGWRVSEYKAWQEFCKENKVEYEYLAFGRMQAVVLVKSIGD